MASLVEYYEWGRVRWRVNFERDGSGRKLRFTSHAEACRKLYLEEMHLLTVQTLDRQETKRAFTVKKMIQFYLGYQWDRVEGGKVTEVTYDRAEKSLRGLPEALTGRNLGEVSRLVIEESAPKGSWTWLRAAARQMVEHGLIVPGGLKSFPAEEKRERGDVVVPLETEIAGLYRSTDDAVLHMFVYLASTCGLRVSEILGLKREDVRGNKLLVRRHETEKGLRGGVKRGRGRELPLSGEFFGLLDKLDPRCDWLIYRREGKVFRRYGLSGIQSRMRSVYRRAGVKFTSHELRHFAASCWLMEGREILEVSHLLGHKDVLTTLRLYGHLLRRPKELRGYGLEGLERGRNSA